jgi:hypothetical protein
MQVKKTNKSRFSEAKKDLKTVKALFSKFKKEAYKIEKKYPKSIFFFPCRTEGKIEMWHSLDRGRVDGLY